MTHDDIIKMAKEADLWLTSDERIAAVVRFAELVAAAEREKIISANAPEIERINEYIKSLEEAVAAEREACAVRAGIALLGVDRELANRVDQSIRGREKK